MSKKITSFALIFSLLLTWIIFSPSKAAAQEGSADVLHNVFVDTLYGMATGFVLMAAVSAAQGEDEGNQWAKNLGAGAAIGGLVGAAYGIAVEYKGVAEIKNNKVCFNLPAVNVSSNQGSGDITLHTNVLKVSF